mgnify:CR=1 FL=1
MQSEQGRLTHLYFLINLNTFKGCKLLFENGACSTISTTVQIRLPNSRWCLRFSLNFREHFHYEIQYSYKRLTGSSGVFITGLLRLPIECVGLPGRSLNMSSRNSIGGGTAGTANDCLNTPRNWLRRQQYQMKTYTA